MKNPLASQTSANLGILVARLALGASLLMAGYAHFSSGVKIFANSNASNLPRWMPGEAKGNFLAFHSPEHRQPHIPTGMGQRPIERCFNGRAFLP